MAEEQQQRRLNAENVSGCRDVRMQGHQERCRHPEKKKGALGASGKNRGHLQTTAFRWEACCQPGQSGCLGTQSRWVGWGGAAGGEEAHVDMRGKRLNRSLRRARDHSYLPLPFGESKAVKNICVYFRVIFLVSFSLLKWKMGWGKTFKLRLEFS